MRKVVIAGAAGRDFHNFNLVFRGNDDVHVVAFTATQVQRMVATLPSQVEYLRQLRTEALVAA